MTNKPNVRRYDNMGCPEEICRFDAVHESDDGDCVLYEDYEALQAECERLKATLESLLDAAPDVQGEPLEALASQLLAKRAEILGRPLKWAEAIEITAIVTSMPDEEKQRLLDMDDAPDVQKPAPDVVGLVDALEQCITSMLDSGYRADAVVIRAARSAIAAHRKQEGGGRS